MKETNGTLYQHFINFPAGKDAKIGWCVFKAKPESDWTTEKLKEKQDSEKAAWAVQDLYEIMKPAGIESYFSQPFQFCLRFSSSLLFICYCFSHFHWFVCFFAIFFFLCSFRSFLHFILLQFLLRPIQSNFYIRYTSVILCDW